MSERVSEENAANPLCGESAPPLDPYDKPHIPEKCRAGLAVAHQGKPLAALAGDAEPILERLRNGESVRAMAAELGVSGSAFYAWLIRNAPDEFLAISAGRSLTRIEQAEEDLDSAEDQLTVSKARESARLAQWTLERANRKLYGDNKQENTGVTVQVLIARDSQTITVDQEPA